MPRLILHIGYGKTGTTYLQSALHRNRAALRDVGVLYPEMRNGLTKHAPVVPFLAGLQTPTSYHSGWAQTDALAESPGYWQDTLDQIARHHPETVILSDESLVYCYDQAATLAANLAPHFDDIRIVAYLDSPQRAFLKLAQQELKSRGIAPRRHLLRYRKQLSAFAGEPAFTLDPHVYDRAHFPSGDVLAHFTGLYCPKWAGLTPELASGDLNPGLSAEAMAVAETYGQRWQRGIDLAQRAKTWARLQIVLIDADSAVPDAGKPALKDDIAAYFQRAHPDLLWLRDEHGLVFDDVDYAIASSGAPDVAPSLNVHDICRVDPAREAEILARVAQVAGSPDAT